MLVPGRVCTKKCPIGIWKVETPQIPRYLHSIADALSTKKASCMGKWLAKVPEEGGSNSLYMELRENLLPGEK